MVHLDSFLLQRGKEETDLRFLLKSMSNGCHLQVVTLQVGSKRTTSRSLIDAWRSGHMIMQVTLCLFEQLMQECVSTNTTGAVQNVLLIQDIDGIIIHVERTSLIQTKSEGIIHLKNHVRTAVVGPKGASWVKLAEGNEIDFSGIRGSDQLYGELDDINGEGGLQKQLSGMELSRVALARVCHKGRLPKLVGL
jgi:hypothetical protein